MEAKIISISDNRQITIPKEYYDKLGLGNKAECIYKDGTIIIKPLFRYNEDFSEEILKDLVAEGYEGQILLEEFKQRKENIKFAVDKLKEEGEKIVSGDIEGVSFDDVFPED